MEAPSWANDVALRPARKLSRFDRMTFAVRKFRNRSISKTHFGRRSTRARKKSRRWMFVLVGFGFLYRNWHATFCLLSFETGIADGASMTRAGREPAEDVKRRLVAACQEVGLVVENANMHLLKEHSQRIVHVGASPTEWTHKTPMISVMATVPVSGQWPESVDIRCNASDANDMHGPWMRGRNQVPFTEMIDQLRETLNERTQVLALVQSDTPPPYLFARAVWDHVDLF